MGVGGGDWVRLSRTVNSKLSFNVRERIMSRCARSVTRYPCIRTINYDGQNEVKADHGTCPPRAEDAVKLLQRRVDEMCIHNELPIEFATSKAI